MFIEQSCEYQFLELDFHIHSVPEPYEVLVLRVIQMRIMLAKESDPHFIGGK